MEDPEIIEVVVESPSSARAETLARVTGAQVDMVGFARSKQPVYRIIGGEDVFKKLRDDGIVVKRVPIPKVK